MKKRWIVLALVLVLCLTCAAYLHYETLLPAAEILPEENWTEAQIYIGIPGVGEELWEGTLDAAEVLSVMERTTVTRGPKFAGMTQPYFWLRLKPDSGPETFLYIQEGGLVAVAIEADVDHYQYYEHGQELYVALDSLVE